MNAQMQKVLLGVWLLSLATGCQVERSVEITLVTLPREGQFVQDDYVEIVEGQAMGVRVIGLKKDVVRPHWTIEARPENPAVLRVQETEGEKEREDGKLFVISAPAAGATQIRFRLDGRHEVFVDAVVTPRPEWEPTVPPAEFGGAPGE